MHAQRVDDFVGDDRTYVGYLCETLSGIPLPQCIPQLEDLVKLCRSQHRILDLPRIRLVLKPAQPVPPPSLNINLWDPVEKPSTPRRSSPVWVERTATFFKNLPTSEDQWRKKRESLGLSDVRGILQAFDYLTTGRLDGDKCFMDHTGMPGLQDALETFACNVGLGLVSGKRNLQVSRFLSLTLIATFCVAIHEGHPVQLVDAAQRRFLETSRGKCDAGQLQLQKDRTVVLWLLAEQQRQFRRGLRHRAFELFFLEGGDIPFYQYCPKEPKENERFTNKIPLCDVPDEIQASLPLWIPFLVKVHVGDRWRYTTICEALGVDLLNQESDFQRFVETLKSEKLVACHPRDLCTTPSAQPLTPPPRPVDTSPPRRHQPARPQANNIDNIKPSDWVSAPRGGGSPLDVPPDAARQERVGQRASRPVPTLGGVEQASSHDGSPVSHGNSHGVLAQQTSPLHLLANVAGWEHEERRSTGVVSTLGPVEPISGSPGSAENAASPSQPDLLVGGGVGSMEQPSASGHSLVILSDGSCLPIGYLEGPAPINNPGHALGIDADGLGGPNGIGLATPQGHDVPTISNRPAKRKRADREVDDLFHGPLAAGHAARQDEGQGEGRGEEQDKSPLDLFFEQIMNFPAE